MRHISKINFASLELGGSITTELQPQSNQVLSAAGRFQLVHVRQLFRVHEDHNGELHFRFLFCFSLQFYPLCESIRISQYRTWKIRARDRARVVCRIIRRKSDQRSDQRFVRDTTWIFTLVSRLVSLHDLLRFSLIIFLIAFHLSFIFVINFPLLYFFTIFFVSSHSLFSHFLPPLRGKERQ